MTWDKVAKRIKELIDADRYLNVKEKENIPQYLEYLESLEVQRQKSNFIDLVADLPPAEKRDTLTNRLSDFLNGLERYEKAFIEKHGLPELETANSEQIETLLTNPKKTQQIMDALASIRGATCDVFSRNHAWRFGLELAELHPRQHAYQLRHTMYIVAQNMRFWLSMMKQSGFSTHPARY